MSRPRFLEGVELDTVWMADAACVQIPGLPWIDNPHRVPVFVWELMAEVCASCPVLDRCREFVAEAEIIAGYWAGESRNRVEPLPRRPRTGRGAA
jgi:hypothetical protein